MGSSSVAGVIRWTRVLAAWTLLACGAVGWGLASSAHAAVASFASTGAEQTFVVPAGIATVHVVAVGGKGGAGNPNLSPASGGAGGVAGADIAVAPGETLYVEVGGNGGDASNAGSGAAGFNGGGSPAPLTSGAGGGGGASDVRTVARAVGAAASLSSRLVVAGGGGAAGAGGTSTPGGAGGGGGAAGSPGAPAFCGGHGGTASAGGAAGTGMGGATAGQLGTGGTGGNATFASGPGGGGLYGGGGGGGGGGSGGFGPGTSNGTFGVDSSGSPSVTISYVVPPTVSLVSPVAGATYAQFGIVYAGYACAAGTGTTISACTAPAANATPIDTSTPGAHTFTVTATDADGGTAAASVAYTVATAPTTSPKPVVPGAPLLTKLRAARSWSLRHGTVFSFSLNEPARVTFAFKRHVAARKIHGKCVPQTKRNGRRRKCTLMTPSGKLVVQAAVGANLKSFSGKLTSGGKLRPGVYSMAVLVTDAAGHTASVPAVTFALRAR